MLIAIASDHNGTGLKAGLVKALESPDWHFVDLGPLGSEAVDYTDYARQVGQIVADGGCDFGVLICGTGVGMSVAANKIDGVRAALVHSDFVAQKSREHNDANVLCLGSWIRTDAENIGAAEIFLTAPFGEKRHVRRVEKIERTKNNIVFANGVFDILHHGHIEMLKWAKSLGGWLVIGINSDDSVRFLKGPGRPVNSAWDRKSVLQSLRFVDEVIVFEERTPARLLSEIGPEIVVKGAEWTEAEVRLRDDIPDWCAVKVFPIVPDYSTTKVIEKVRAPEPSCLHKNTHPHPPDNKTTFATVCDDCGCVTGITIISPGRGPQPPFLDGGLLA